MTEEIITPKPPRSAKATKSIPSVVETAVVETADNVAQPVLQPVVAEVVEPKRYYVSEGEAIEVKVEYINGKSYLAESVWKEVPLPFSNGRKTRVLIAAKGTVFNG